MARERLLGLLRGSRESVLRLIISQLFLTITEIIRP